MYGWHLVKENFSEFFFISCFHPFEILMYDQVFIIWRKRNHFFKASDLNILNTSITGGGETEKCIDLYILPHKMQKSSDDEETDSTMTETARCVLSVRLREEHYGDLVMSPPQHGAEISKAL